LQLIDRGLLSFDIPVIDFLGLYDTAILGSVKVFHLLTHTSGIADDADEESGEDYADICKTRSNYAVIDTADFLYHKWCVGTDQIYPSLAQARLNFVDCIVIYYIHPSSFTD
jgi:Beta-lactamase